MRKYQKKINRSAKAIRGRVFAHYLTERLDLVRAYIGNGRFGDNIPNRPLKYRRLMTEDARAAANSLLAALAGEIKGLHLIAEKRERENNG